MNRASVSYLFMFATLIGALWAILRAGAPLRAPADLAGRWAVEWESPAADLPQQVAFEQSGVFAFARVGTRALGGRLTKIWHKPDVSGVLASRDGSARLSLATFTGGDELHGTYTAAGRNTPFTAHRETERARDAQPKPTTAP